MRDLLHGKRVLVLEDSAIVAMELEDRIVALGAIRVRCCTTAAAAAQAVAEGPIDIALCDVNVGDGSSLAFVEELREKNVCCVLLTGYAEIPGMGPCLAHVPVLRKPVLPADLATALAALLSGR